MAMVVVVAAVSAAIEVGSLVYRLLNRPKLRPPVSDLQISAAVDGAPIPFGWGQVRIAGTLIWTPGLYFVKAGVPGSGSSFGGGATQFLFFADFMFAFCEGPATILRMWGDSKLIYDSTPGTSEYPPADFPAWSSTTLYNIGDIVSYNGVTYTCEQENTNIFPGQAAILTGGILYWQALGSYAPFDFNTQYNPGDVVIQNGQLYVNIQSTYRLANPGNNHYWKPLTIYYPPPTLYPGTQTQVPDPDIQAAQGVANTPAFRGLCCAKFKKFPLANFGNRIPNIRAEIAIGTASGPVIWQQATFGMLEPNNTPSATLPLSIETTDFLIAIARWRPDGGSGEVPTIADDSLNVWTPLYANDNKGIWILAGPAAVASLTVTATYTGGFISYDSRLSLLAIRGAVSHSSAVNNGTASPMSVTNGIDTITLANLVGTGGNWAAALLEFTDENGAVLKVAPWLSDGEFELDISTVLDSIAYEDVFSFGWESVASVFASGIPKNRLSQVVLNVCERAGLPSSEVDVSLLTSGTVFPNDIVQGYAITRPTSGAEITKALFSAYFFDACESDGTLRFVPRGLASAITIPEADLGLLQDGAKVKPEQISQSQDLPQNVSILYNDISMDYQQGKQYKGRSSRVIKTRQQEILEMPISMDANFARQVAEKTLWVAWLERTSYTLNLWRALYMLLDPTDVIEFVYEGITFQMRAIETLVGQGFAIKISGVSDNANNYLSAAVGGSASGFVPQPVSTNSPTMLFLFDVPLLRDQDSNPGNTGFYDGLSSALVDWPGGAIFRSSDDANYGSPLASSSTPVSFGYATNAIGNPASPFSWDTVNSLTVKMVLGTLTGTTEQNVLDGWNAFLVGSVAGGWEVLQAQNVVLNPDGTYTLSQLLRGRRGTEWMCGFWGDFLNGVNPHAIGDVVIALPVGVLRQADPLALVNQLRYYKGVTSGQDVSEATSQQFTNTGRDLMPYAPVHVGGFFDTFGNLVITWFRRTRIGGGQWLDTSGDLPLSEDSELYEVEILSGSTVVRTFSKLPTSTAIYTITQMTTDFGSVPASVTVNVYQISGEIGRGFKGHGVAPSISPAPEVLPTQPFGFYINGS